MTLSSTPSFHDLTSFSFRPAKIRCGLLDLDKTPNLSAFGSTVLAQPTYSAQQSPAEHLHQQPDAVCEHGALYLVPDLQLCGAERGRQRGPDWAAAVPDLQQPAAVLGHFRQHRLLQVRDSADLLTSLNTVFFQSYLLRTHAT